ncbi:MAG: hypothetical protein LC713_04710 [Actinobacteria bacterium]|nr:hypothetical protein [Actinomycetota bacterium]
MRRIACPRLVGRTLMRGLLSMLVLTALTPAAVAAQSPATGGYAAGGPSIVERTAPTGAEPEGGRLPFTGLQIGMMLIAGLVLLGLGLSLRRSSTRARPSDDYRSAPHPGNSEIQPTLGPRGGP